MEKQYMVQSFNIDERQDFYNYLINNGYEPKENFINDDFINSRFPFVIEPDKTIWICRSVTCCAAAATCNAIITIDEYYNIIKNNNLELVLKLSNKNNNSN